MAATALGERTIMVNTVQNAINAKAISIISTTAVSGITAPMTNVARNR